MKRVIFISILSAFTFSLFFAFSIVWLRSAQWQLEIAFDEVQYPNDYQESMRIVGLANLRNGLLFILGSICVLVTYILIALKEFKVFQPIVDKYNARRNARKEKRAAIKQARDEEAKQKRIEELQNELDELKKD